MTPHRETLFTYLAPSFPTSLIMSTPCFKLISYNGDEVTDSQLIIEFLTEKLGLAKAEAARPEDRVVSRGLRAILGPYTNNIFFMFTTF